MLDYRIGHGYDVHAFGKGEEIILGGVSIPHDRSLLAHSDGDVLLHAICDAMLGAMALGDIGQHFPDSDPEYRNIESMKLLKSVTKMVNDKGYSIGNIDATIVAQVPKLSPYIDAMKQNIIKELKLMSHQCNIKATTTEKLGFAGREEGIAVHSVVLLQVVDDTHEG